MSDKKKCNSCGIFFEGKDIYQHFYDDYKEHGIPSYLMKDKAVDSIYHSYSRIKQLPIPNTSKMTDIEVAAFSSASMYSWTPENKTTFGINMHLVEIPEIYDGVIFGECDSCGFRWKVNPICPDKYINGDTDE